MTPTTDQRIPQASLREEWSVSSVQRLAWTMGRLVTAPATGQRAGAGVSTTGSGSSARRARLHDPAQRARRLDALRRLAADPQATAAERALAVQRLTELNAAAYAAAC